MVLFGIKTEPSGIVETFIEETRERLGKKAKTPFFDGEIFQHGNKFIFNINCYYPPLWYFSIIGVTIGFFFNNALKPILWIGSSILLLPTIFNTKWPYILGFYIGLRKKGYKGKIIIL